MNTKRKTAVFWTLTIFIVWSPILLIILAWLWLTSDTSIYAPGFSEDAFQEIKIGMRRESVYELLGPPISRKNVDSPESWSYTRVSVKRSWFRTATDIGEYRSVRFDALGHVIEVHGNSIKSLVREGMEKQEVRSLLGEPTKIYPQRSEILHYSSPAEWGTYRARVISIDRNGLVSRITTYDAQD